MPAKKLQRRVKKKKINYKKYVVLIIAIALAIFVISFINAAKEDKLSIVFASKESVEIATFDFAKQEIFKIVIPANTQVNLADDLGEWKLSAVGEIGINEGNKDLLRKTIIKNFGFPVAYWAYDEGIGLASDAKTEIIRSVFSTYDSNVNFSQKVRIAIFALRIKNTNRQSFNLKDTIYLQPAEFVDGSRGFVPTSSVPERLYLVFEDYDFRQIETIVIYNAGGGFASIETFSTIAQMMGNKVTLTQSADTNDYTCRLYIAAKDRVQKLADILGCEIFAAKQEGFELEVYLGSEFL